MFQQEGSGRSVAKNQALAGYLAFVAGFVNSCGFVMLGVLTSHVTGNVSRLADRIVAGTGIAAAVVMIVAFFLGAFSASLALEAKLGLQRQHVYGGLLLSEAAVLAGAALGMSEYPEAARILLCAAMGLQNSLVTRLSGAVVRTTHLTGVVTDLGIEAARWVRHRSFDSEPTRDRLVLHATIVLAFSIGSVLGVLGGIHAQRAAFALPAVLLIAGGIFGLVKAPAMHRTAP